MIRFLLSWLISSPSLTAVDCIAHRGDSLHHPENSREAIASAWKKGSDIVELDIRMTRDGELVLFHDAEINKKQVSEMSHAELDAEDREKQVIALRQCLQGAETGQVFLLDLKEHGEAFLKAVVSLVESATPSGVVVILQSNRMDTLASLRDLASADRALFYVTDLKPRPRASELAAELKKRKLQGITAKGRQFVDKEFVAEFQKRGLKYYVWTINPRERIEHYVGLGVDGVITDNPALFCEVVGKSQ
ncbi:MAG: glycerophosphodiester phosphodiesterase [Akkermansiaceae bacterium]|nr:glycerophosphodiester phosphodiesterase [Akkermansiaceae bacterium]